MTDEILSIKRFFEQNQVLLSVEWLQSCIGWCKEENLNSNYTQKELQLKVYEQWLLLDFRDVLIPCLPPNLSSQVKYILTGNYSLQMMQIIDLSKPKHWQLQRIRNPNMSLAKTMDQENEFGKRVLQITLTDGVQQVEAMEYKPVANLNLNLAPGVKIRLMGPVTVRRGRIMLEAHNIKVLGGEVEEIIVSNAAENVLARALNLKENPNPNVIQESFSNANTDLFKQENPENRKKIVSSTVGNKISEIKPTVVSNNLNRFDLTAAKAEELQLESEIDELMETEREFQQPFNTKRPKSTTPDLFDDDGINDSDFNNVNTSSALLCNSIPATGIPPTTTIAAKARHASEDLSESLDIFENIDIDAHLDQVDKEIGYKQLLSPKNNLITIEKLLKNRPYISKGVFKLSAKFKSIAEKLTFTDDMFYLVINIEDDSGEMAVRVHSDLIADFAGYSPPAILALKCDIKNKDSSATGKLIKAIQNVKERLLLLDNVLEIKIDGSKESPTIVKIF